MSSTRPNTPATKGVLIRWASLYDTMGRVQFLGREHQFREWQVLSRGGRR